MRKLLLFSCITVSTVSLHAQNCADIFISEYVEGTFNNKAIELYTPTDQPIDLGAGQYSMGRDRDGQGVPMLLNITGIIPAHDVRVFALDKRDPNGTGNETPISNELMAAADTFLNPVYVQSNSPMYFNGDDAFVVVKGGNTILDIVGKIGEDPGEGWWVPGDPASKWWTTDNTLIRKSTIQQGVTVNPMVFDPSLEWDSLPANTFSNLGTHNCVCGSVGIKEETSPGFRLFPNPLVNGDLSIISSHKIFAYSVFSSNGQLIKREENSGNSTYCPVAVPDPIPGIYFIEVTFTDGTKSYQKLLAR
ncbi:MAG: T9SS type A sorting domain-containing protein [Crocinitomicaceae bacterium]|nr:T9SS type A sorting domain-containing protein [Crocinitomicaceae bacterium]